MLSGGRKEGPVKGIWVGGGGGRLNCGCRWIGPGAAIPDVTRPEVWPARGSACVRWCETSALVWQTGEVAEVGSAGLAPAVEAQAGTAILRTLRTSSEILSPANNRVFISTFT